MLGEIIPEWWATSSGISKKSGFAELPIPAAEGRTYRVIARVFAAQQRALRWVRIRLPKAAIPPR
jgi:hypothetical protein